MVANSLSVDGQISPASNRKGQITQANYRVAGSSDAAAGEDTLSGLR
jgi:hypothetical protein